MLSRRHIAGSCGDPQRQLRGLSGSVQFSQITTAPITPVKRGALQTNIESLDRQRYSDGDWLMFEVIIKNVGSIPLKIPFSIDLAELQPEDAAQGFRYSALQVSLLAAAGNNKRVIGLAMVRIYGAEGRPNTMVTLHPGEWVRIAGRDKIHFPTERSAVDLMHSGAIDNASPQ